MLMQERWAVRVAMSKHVPSYLHAAADAVLFADVFPATGDIRIEIKDKLRADMPVVFCVGSMQIYGYRNDNIGGTKILGNRSR